MSTPPADARGATLLALARAAVESAVHNAQAARIETPASLDNWLTAPGATFVTILCAGELRGCIGSVRPRRALRDDVEANARAAAISDPRFPPLGVSDLGQLQVEVSLLSPLEPLPSPLTEAVAGALLRPTVDGVVLENGAAGATFLPQVWAQLPAAEAFLRALKQKAGLAPGPWPSTTRLFRYTVEKWSGEP